MNDSERHLIAEISQWRKANGWSLSGQRGWVNAPYSGGATVAVDYHEWRDGFTVDRKHEVSGVGAWSVYPDFHAATSVRQAVDMLVALDVLPAQFSSAHRAGRPELAQLMDAAGRVIAAGRLSWDSGADVEKEQGDAHGALAEAYREVSR